jgi:hypothetical protein
MLTSLKIVEKCSQHFKNVDEKITDNSLKNVNKKLEKVKAPGFNGAPIC